jgi:hypothetical protein
MVPAHRPSGAAPCASLFVALSAQGASGVAGGAGR